MKKECDAIKKEHSENKKELLAIKIMLVEMRYSEKGVDQKEK